MHQQKVDGDLGRHVSNINELNKLELLKKLKPIKLKLRANNPHFNLGNAEVSVCLLATGVCSYLLT